MRTAQPNFPMLRKKMRRRQMRPHRLTRQMMRHQMHPRTRPKTLPIFRKIWCLKRCAPPCLLMFWRALPQGERRAA